MWHNSIVFVCFILFFLLFFCFVLFLRCKRCRRHRRRRQTWMLPTWRKCVKCLTRCKTLKGIAVCKANKSVLCLNVLPFYSLSTKITRSLQKRALLKIHTLIHAQPIIKEMFYVSPLTLPALFIYLSLFDFLETWITVWYNYNVHGT